MPKPYDPKFILATCRLNDGENKGEFSKETQNDLHNKRFVFEDLSGGYVNYYEANKDGDKVFNDIK
ncbi:hypothetical protein [Clostridium saccharobutylicum]|uniref:Uncharacterized protein n=1 Tax=Clostridium saccharobutylicum DSM 13864 TaxID=1345695 RepID=U5MMX3_CLOSA|nr:hypothetical protein [Clostridium saccharobutylicum]AGX41905.1 hypothetical protein CLSA_c08930 [Clostridium saccharobutylicum DSM 13864]AQR89183.1 hypothetical protein CLOSC_08800 [Clostridium saccharobutylicum]AQR99084.1 hypothetical protein CSACC_08870 [Clostridium saccharobutylicum]AQS08806.1 hypothetical protein CLOBY_09190 [Clostridium saccharobutylicum]AQS13072.1 hypothetical protein CLOSACC_08870 [Clostridium saccharobutylicum]